MVHNANTACRGLCPRTRASTAVGILLYRYSNRSCALPCRSRWYSTRTPLVAVIVLFYVHTPLQARWWTSCYIAIVMCAFAHFLAAHFCAQREHRLSRSLFFFLYPLARASTAVGILLYRYSNVRFCALPCRSQWYTTRTPLVAVIVLFYVHALVQARRWT